MSAIGPRERAALLRATADDFAKRVENDEDVVAVFAAPGESMLLTHNHPAMDLTVLATNAFLAGAFGAGAQAIEDDETRDERIARLAIERFVAISNPGLPGLPDVLNREAVQMAVAEAVRG